MLASLDLMTEAPDYENLLDSAVALGIASVRHGEGTPEAIEYLLKATAELATLHADANSLDVETVLPTYETKREAEVGYREAYARESKVAVDDLHPDLGGYPDGLPYVDGLPKTFVARVARAEAAADRAFRAEMRRLHEPRA